MTTAPAAPASWSPILAGEDAQRAAAAVTAVAEALGHAPLPAGKARSPLSSGDAGIALLFAYLDRARPGQGYGEIALERLERAIDAMAASALDPGLFAGFTGVAWADEHLRGGSERSEDSEGSEGSAHSEGSGGSGSDNPAEVPEELGARFLAVAAWPANRFSCRKSTASPCGRRGGAF